MFGTGRWGVNGKILDKDGNVKYRLSGSGTRACPDAPGAADDAARTLWTKEPAPADPPNTLHQFHLQAERRGHVS